MTAARNFPKQQLCPKTAGHLRFVLTHSFHTELFLWQQCDHREVRGSFNNSVVVDMGKGNVYLGFMVKLQKKRTSLKVKVRWTGRRWFKKSDGS